MRNERRITISLIRSTNFFLQQRHVAGSAEPLRKVPLHLANFPPLEAGQASGAA
jgi:hypothetical protein